MMAQEPEPREAKPASDEPRHESDKSVPHTRTDERGKPREPRQPGMGEDEDKHYEPEKEREDLAR